MAFFVLDATLAQNATPQTAAALSVSRKGIYMIFYLLPSLVLLLVGSMQYIHCIRMPGPRSLRKSTHFLGLVCSVAFCGLFIAGFIFLKWWVPIMALPIGAALRRVLQSRVRPPELIYFSAVLSIPLVVMFVEAV